MSKWVERYTPIPLAELPAMIGKPIHLSWATSPGFVWILDRVVGDRMHLHTPKTGKRLISHVRDAIYTRHYCPKHQEVG